MDIPYDSHNTESPAQTSKLEMRAELLFQDRGSVLAKSLRGRKS